MTVTVLLLSACSEAVSVPVMTATPAPTLAPTNMPEQTIAPTDSPSLDYTKPYAVISDDEAEFFFPLPDQEWEWFLEYCHNGCFPDGTGPAERTWTVYLNLGEKYYLKIECDSDNNKAPQKGSAIEMLAECKPAIYQEVGDSLKPTDYSEISFAYENGGVLVTLRESALIQLMHEKKPKTLSFISSLVSDNSDLEDRKYDTNSFDVAVIGYGESENSSSDAPAITDNGGPNYAPTFSSDGTKIMLVSERDGNFEIYVMNPDGSDFVNLTNNPAQDSSPDWSPDGSKIAFATKRDGNYEIYMMNSDGSELVNLTNNSERDSNPTWSPDGNKIAFTSERDGKSEIYTMNPDGSNLAKLVNNSGGESYYNLAWSPDGAKLVFVSDREGNDEIYTINTDGTELVNITNTPENDYDPAWSSDSKMIAFTSERDGNEEIYLINSDGSGLVNLTNDSASDFSPSWSPDNTQIIFTSIRDGKPEIFRMNSDGTDVVKLTGN